MTEGERATVNKLAATVGCPEMAAVGVPNINRAKKRLTVTRHGPHCQATKAICENSYPCFEISAVNPDKPPLSVTQIKDRVKQFEKVGKTVIISNQPYFYKKAEIFPGSAFVIGADTAARIVHPKYYAGDYNKMINILTGCKATGCTFLVGGRNVDGIFKVLDDLEIPVELKDMFISIPEEKFRIDISSTEIRKKLGM
ncbi:hypothetical protein TIFTF001_007874 [Ficus carica]|uniref:Uncharacterized protein n=1 Tax=Ficus carica TaxID=3494 RepID=A0AA87ZKB9_FICCA|nr:hypothetical protein TIFTF001_007874 [Ficus carica]